MDKEFRQYSRTMAEECTKERLVDLYIAEVETCVEVEEQLAITEKALELAVETMRYELGRDAIKNLYKDAIKNLKDNLNMKVDVEMCEWFKEQAEEMIKSE